MPPYPLILNLLKDGPPPFHPILRFLPPLPILQQVQDERKEAGYRDNSKKPPSPGNREMTAIGFLIGNRPVTPPYFRVRRMTFLQVALQVRLCRARKAWALTVG